MSEPQPNSPPSSTQTIIFMVVLSFFCALVLSILASALSVPKEVAKDLDRSKQLMIAAKILSHGGYFLLQDENGKDIPAKYVENGILEPSDQQEIATQAQLLDVYQKRIISKLVDDKGDIHTFKDEGIDENEYVAKYKKSGYYKQPLKLVYFIMPNPTSESQKTEDVKPIGYVIPVNGMGLWDAIYGYLALKPDASGVLGISWYDQKETPGLGANISEPEWQSLFPGKSIFLMPPTGKGDYNNAPLGITVVKGKVQDVYGDSPKSKVAVDGMTGATLTGNGVTDAYRDVLAAYKPFLIKLAEQEKK